MFWRNDPSDVTNRRMRRFMWVVAVGLCATLGFNACGGGGGGGGTPAGPPPPNPLYVSARRGKDTNIGDRSAPLKTISKAAQIVRSGYSVFVGSGTYQEGVTTPSVGTPPQGIQFIADVSGAQTGDSAGAVIVDVSTAPSQAGFNLFNSPGSMIDGFEIRGAGDAGIVIKNGSTDFTIQNCVVHDNPGDGIRVQDSSNAVVFNNLVYNNQQRGIAIVAAVAGSPNANIISNTIVSNHAVGLTIGNAAPKPPSSGAFVRNNIVEQNLGDSNVKVFTDPRSDLGLDEDFDLIFPAGSFNPKSIQGKHDVGTQALFLNASTGDYHLRSNSTNALDVGDSLSNMQALANLLRGRTTTGGTDCDKGALDLGFHYAPSGRCTTVVP